MIILWYYDNYYDQLLLKNKKLMLRYFLFWTKIQKEKNKLVLECIWNNFPNNVLYLQFFLSHCSMKHLIKIKTGFDFKRDEIKNADNGLHFFYWYVDI